MFITKQVSDGDGGTVLEEQDAADALFDLLKRAGVRLQRAALKAGKDAAGAEMDSRWKILVNERIEIDEL